MSTSLTPEPSIKVLRNINLGNFKNHLKNGHGKDYLINGNFYQGNFINNMRDGIGYLQYFSTG